MTPILSIIIPTHNPALLAQCLSYVTKHYNAGINYEEIIVADTTPDHSIQSSRINSLLRTPDATFAQACNEAVRHARGDYLLLLNDDIILHGRLWSRLEDGITGARLLYPNGLIQHAGVGFDNDGNPYHLWQHGPGDHPEAMKARYLPAVTFACALIGKCLWQELGGLDERYINAYEDVDFCLRARERGYPVRYVSEAVATHLTAQTPGRFNHNAESWQHFQDVWLRDGRIYYALGMWPFSVERKG